MGISWTNIGQHFKSPLRVAAQVLWRSRENKRAINRELRLQLDEAQKTITRQKIEIARGREECHRWQERWRQGDEQRRREASQRSVLPEDPPLPGHRFGRRLIRLAVNLARLIGLRPAERVLKIVWEWLGVEQRLPDWTTIRTWLLRVGLAVLQEPVEKSDDWVWLADHSNQIGPEKALVVLAVRASRLPPPGATLRHEDMQLLTVQPGVAWKRENVEAAYRQLAERHGPPRAVLCDGAAELREGAKILQNEQNDTLVISDFKHKAAIFLKTAVGGDPRFAAFNAQLGKTHAAIQQTELAHLTPPTQKTKARFMNLAATLDWAAAVLWLLGHPAAESRRFFSSERLEEKLGWLRSFADELAAWRECQEAVQRGVTFINEQGLFRGASLKLREAIGMPQTSPAGRELTERLVQFVAAAEDSLREGERLPMSTEILESTFALYKQLERQHSKGGFTSLLAGFGALLKPATDAGIRQAFAKVSVKDVNRWTREHLGTTLTSKRFATYQEFRSATISPTTT
jgi:hypothetical protein